MAFPLPADPEYRKEVIMLWLDDVEDRLKAYSVSDAEKSWKIAQYIYLSLPPGEGSNEIESALVKARVKLDKLTESKT